MEEEIKVLLNVQKKIVKRSSEIQKNYDFRIPDYILSELAKAEKNGLCSNVISLINLAIINGKLSKENAIVLEKDIKDRSIYKIA